MTEQAIAETKTNQEQIQEVEVKQTENVSSNQKTEPEESQKDIDWRKFRENRQKEREAAALDHQGRIKAEQEAAALKAALEAVVNKPNNNQYVQPGNSYEEETDDQKIDRRVAEALAKREIELEKKRQQEENVNFPNKLRSTFKDFDQVCSAENLDYLEYHHPELASELGSKPQGFEKWAKTYNAVKRYIPNIDAKKDMQRMDKNMQKPGSISSPSLSQSGKSAILSQKEIEIRRTERWKEMERMRKSVG
jgi:hypothetical protein